MQSNQEGEAEEESSKCVFLDVAGACEEKLQMLIAFFVDAEDEKDASLQLQENCRPL